MRRTRLNSRTAPTTAPPLHAWYGVGVFTDTAADTDHAADGSVRGVAALMHLCGVRG
ncbi:MULTISPECIES: hypothetical protein [Streptomyces]|uniref:hypothetical protein n=1 Tax=Streptomyces TaxID=1883 RepID=UPI0033D5199D